MHVELNECFIHRSLIWIPNAFINQRHARTWNYTPNAVTEQLQSVNITDWLEIKQKDDVLIMTNASLSRGIWVWWHEPLQKKLTCTTSKYAAINIRPDADQWSREDYMKALVYSLNIQCLLDIVCHSVKLIHCMYPPVTCLYPLCSPIMRVADSMDLQLTYPCT